MYKYSILKNIPKATGLACVVMCLAVLAACGGGGGDASDIDRSGSISFKLKFVNSSQTSAARVASAVNICNEYEIEEVRAYLKRMDGTEVASAAWPCEEHGGVLDNVDPATDLVLIIEGMVGGAAIWKGQKGDIKIIAGQITPVGTVLVINVQDDVTAPQITSVVPLEDAAKVPINSAITVNFDESISAISLQNAFQLSDSDSTAVDGTVSYFDDHSNLVWQAKFTPSSDLKIDTDFTVSLLAVVEDLAGNPVEQKTWSFTTGSTTVPGLIWGQHNWDEANWQ